MTRNDSLRIRDFLTWLFNKEGEQYLHVASAKNYKHIDTDDWSVYIYGDHEESTFLVDGALLINGIVLNCTSFRASIGHYDVGTTEPDIRCAVILR